MHLSSIPKLLFCQRKRSFQANAWSCAALCLSIRGSKIKSNENHACDYTYVVSTTSVLIFKNILVPCC